MAAQECGLAARKGWLRAGRDADLLLVDGDPLRDITALRRPVAVMVHGSWADLPDHSPPAAGVLGTGIDA